MQIHKIIVYSFLPIISIWGQTNPSNADTPFLDEITVQGASIPELDLSRSSILTQEQVEDRRINDLVDLSGLTPNLHINANGIQSYGDIITMRGIANTQLFGPAGVQLYVDGVPQADVSSYSSTLYNVESIEILRGPQGHSFGKSVTGGAINIKTKAPSNLQTNLFSASYGTFDSQKYNLGSSGPLDKSLSYTLALQRALTDGFVKNSAGSADTAETWHGVLKFHYDKGTGTKAALGLSFESHELGAQPLIRRNPSDFYARSTDFDESTDIDRNQQFLSVEHELGESRLISITNRNDWSMNPNRVDLDMSAFPISTSIIIQDHIEWTQELRLESEEDSELDWVLGSFYADSLIDGDATRWFLTGLAAPFDQDTQVTSYRLESKNIGIFASLGMNLSEKDFVSLGLRYDKFDKEMKRTKTSLLAPTSSVPGSKDFNSLSPSLLLERNIQDGLDGIIRITYAEKPGGFSAYSDDATIASFSEEKTMAYELGILFNPSEKWGLNLTAYLNDIEKYQFELPVPSSTDYYVANADEATAQGLEIEGFIKPSDSFTLSVAYGICDAEYEKFDSLPGLVGKQVSFIPDHTLSCSLNYQLDNGFYGQIGTKTIGKVYFWEQDGANSSDKIDSYTLLDANLGFDYDAWSFNLFGLNLTDEEYYTSLVSNLKSFTGGDAPGIAGSPRVIGLSVSKEF